jgi:hypothetical protein
MQYVYIIVLGLHVMAGVFWAGTTIAVGRDPDIRVERFFRPQMGAAGMVFLTGALLWYSSKTPNSGPRKKVLALGIATALIAAGVQGALVGSASRQLAGTDAATEAKLRAKMTRGERIAGGLLVITVLCMAVARMF